MKNLFKNTKFNVLLVALFSILFFLPQIAMASSSAGTITIILGKVDLLRPGTERATPVYAGQELNVGDIVRTKSESKAEISLNDGSTIRLAEETRLEISEAMLEGGKRKKSSLRLFRGKIRSMVSNNSTSRSRGNFEVHTPTAIAGVRGTDFYVYYIGSSGILVTEGVVAVFNPAVGKEVLVKAGYATNVGHGKPPGTPRPVGKPEFDKHDKDTNPGYEDSFNNSGVSFISELVGELEPFERHLYVFELLAKNDPPPPPEPPPGTEPPPVEPPPVEPPPPDNGNEPPPPWTPEGPPGDPSPPPANEPPPVEPPPVEPPPVEPPPPDDMPFPPPPSPPDNGNEPPPPWTPEGPPGDPSPPPANEPPPVEPPPAPEPPPESTPPPWQPDGPPGDPSPPAPAPELPTPPAHEPPAHEPPVHEPPVHEPHVPAPGNSDLPFPPPAPPPDNGHEPPAPWTDDGPPGKPNPGKGR